MKNATIIFSILLLFSCGNRDHLALNDIRSLVSERPDSALSALEAMDTSRLCSPAMRAEYHLLLAMALDKCYIDTTDVSIITPAVRWFSKHGGIEDRIRALYYLGRIQHNAGNYRDAIVSYTEAVQFFEDCSDFVLLGQVEMGIADAYGKTYDDNQDLEHVELARKFFIRSEVQKYIDYSLYRKAQSLCNLSRREEALALYDSLLSSSKTDSIIVTNSLSKKSLVLTQLGDTDYRGHIDLFEKALGYGGKPTVNQWCAYAFNLYMIGEKDKAEAILQSMEKGDGTARLESQLWRCRIAEKDGDYKTAYQYLESTLTRQNDIVYKTLENSLSKTTRDYFKTKEAQFKAIADKRKYALIATTLALFLLIYVLGILFNNHLKKEKEERMRMAMALEDIKNNKPVSEDMKQFYLSLFKDQLKDLAAACEQYEFVKLNKSLSGKEELAAIEKIMDTIEGNSEKQGLFEKHIDKFFNNIMTSFREDFPHLKNHDYVLFSHQIAGFSGSTSSWLLRCSPGVVYTRKNRLKKTIVESASPRKEEYLSFLL